MSSKWTVTPESDRLTLTHNGETFWLEVKRDLTTGEQRLINTAGFKGLPVSALVPPRPASLGAAPREPEVGIDWVRQSYIRTETYVLDWSLADDHGNKLPRTRATLEALHPDVYEAIENAITAHVEARAAQKKIQSGGDSAPLATSA